MIKKIKEPPVYTGKPAVTNTELQNIFKVADRSDLNNFSKLIENTKRQVLNKQRNKEKEYLLFKTTNLTPNDERLVGLNEEDITKIKNVIDYSNSISKYFKDKSKKNEILPRDLNTIIDRNNTKLNKEGLSDKFHYVLNRPTTSYGDSISNNPIFCLEKKQEPDPVQF